MSTHFFVAICALGLGLSAIATQGLSEDPQKSDAKANVESKSTVVKSDFKSQRASKLIGMDVQNTKGESLGEINDLVMDFESGKVRYAALSFGGFLGVGDKLFAVPMSALKIKHDGEDTYFVLNVEKQKLKNAPGFNQDAWPDLTNSQLTSQIDAFYGVRNSDAAANDRDATRE